MSDPNATPPEGPQSSAGRSDPPDVRSESDPHDVAHRGPDSSTGGDHSAGGEVRSEPAAEAGQKATSAWRIAGRWALRIVAFVIVVTLVAAVVPVSSDGLEARPDPTSTYDEAIERFDEIVADEADLGVTEKCRSRRYVHDERTDVAVVLYHGLTNCPQQFVDFAEELYDAGSNVIILRAPHHGLGNDDGTIGDVGKVGPLSADELRDFADDSVDIAVGLGERVEVLGLSMGGVLAMWTAQFRGDVDRVVALAPAISIPGAPHFLTTAMINIFNRVPNISLPSSGGKLDHAYSGESTGALAAMFLLAQATENQVADGERAVADDVIVVLNPDDDQVDNGEVTQLVERWSDSDGDVEIIVLDTDGLPHDLIDPAQPTGDVGQVYPVLFDLIESAPA